MSVLSFLVQPLVFSFPHCSWIPKKPIRMQLLMFVCCCFLSNSSATATAKWAHLMWHIRDVFECWLQKRLKSIHGSYGMPLLEHWWTSLCTCSSWPLWKKNAGLDGPWAHVSKALLYSYVLKPTNLMENLRRPIMFIVIMRLRLLEVEYLSQLKFMQ